MEFVSNTPGHIDHDVAWSVVLLSSPEPVCIACLIQHLEGRELLSVQKRLILSLFSTILKDNDEMIVLFRKNLLVIRHLVDILTELSEDSEDSMAVTVCQCVIDRVQCEEIVLYLLDKIEWQLENVTMEKKILPGLLLLGQLVSLSAVYSSILLQTHGELVEKLIYSLSRNDENLQCSIIFIVVQVFESNLHHYIPSPLKQSLVHQTLTILNTSQDLQLQINVLALLKKLLKNMETSCMIQRCQQEYSSLVTGGQHEDSSLVMGSQCEDVSLVMGLKKLFVTKKEVLQTASTQCLMHLLSTSQSNQPIHDILNSDLTEFLFESLHTQSSTQIECVMNCLQKLTEFDLFFTRCHAVYGTESILLVLDTLISMRNTKLMVKGFSLLASFLERQPPSIPLFVNTSTLSTCVNRIQRGLEQHHKPVALQAFRTMAAFLREEYLPPSYVNIALETLLKEISKRMSSLNLEKFSKSQRKNDMEAEELMILFIRVISSAARLLDLNINNCSVPECSQATSSSTSDSTPNVSSLFIQITVDLVLPFTMVLFEKSKDIRLISEHCVILLTVFKLNIPAVLPLTEKLITCGWLIQLLTIKSQIKCKSDMSVESDKISMLLVMAYSNLLNHHDMMPEWLLVGLKQLQLPEVVNEVSLDVLTNKKSYEASLALLMVLYYSYLHNNLMWSPIILGKYIDTFICNLSDLNTLPRLCIKSLVFLLTWLSTQNVPDIVNNSNRRIAGLLRSCPLQSWYTHHPWILHWTFTDQLTTESCGTQIMEMWLEDLEKELNTEKYSEKDEDEKPELVNLAIILKHKSAPLVLMNILVSDDEVKSNHATNIIRWIINKSDSSDEMQELENLTKYSTDLFQNMCRQNKFLKEHQSVNILGILTTLLTDTKVGHHAINSKTIQNLYHVIRMIGNQESVENIITGVSLQYILTILNHKTDLGHLGVSPMLTQNREFMNKLEVCLICSSWDIKHNSIHIITWLAMSDQHINAPYCIRINTSYVIKLISVCPTWCVIAALRLLTVALSTPLKNSPLIFCRENAVIASPLFIKWEIRQIYMYIQQLICQGNTDILEHCVDCLQALFTYCQTSNNQLDKELLRHPWNQVLIDTLIELNYGHRVNDSLLDLLILFQVGEHNICLSGEILTLWLHSVLQTTFTPEKSQLVQQIITKVKQTDVDLQLLKDVNQHLVN